MNANNAGILIVYLHVDVGNLKRGDFYLHRNLPLFFIWKKSTSEGLDFRDVLFHHNGVYGLLLQR